MSKLDIPMMIVDLPRGQQFCLLFPGSEVYSQTKMGAPLTLTDADSKTVDVTVASRKIDALGSLLNFVGSSFAPMVGKPYDIVAVGDNLDAMYPDNPRASAVGELYTMVTFNAIAADLNPVPGLMPSGQ